MPTIAPYGSWHSPVTTELMTGRTIGLSALSGDGDALYWLEARPSEAGRSTLMRWTVAGVVEVTPAPRDVGSRVHEYGGGAYRADAGGVVFSDRREASVWLVEEDATRLITRVEGCRYADFAFDRRRDRVLAVREDHRGRPPNDPLNTIVALDLASDTDPAANEGTVLVEGADFVAAPRLNAAGTALLWLQWNHPDMPWDATQLLTATLDEKGDPSAPTLIAGSEPDSVMQPEWDDEGSISFLSDRSGWWNLYRWREGEITAIAPVEAEIGGSPWQLATPHYSRAADGQIIAALVEHGVRHAVSLDGARWRKLPIGPIAQAPVGFGSGLAALVTPVDRPPEITLFGTIEGEAPTVIAAAGPPELAAEDVSLGEPIEFPTAGGGTAHAFFYPPLNRNFDGPADARPPLVVLIHGGPTSMTHANFSLAIQWWTSRGIAVVDVNYRGSSGYGRDYRRALNGAWGVADVEDCIAVVEHLVAEGRVDGERVAIRGGSAGGFTVLSALTRSRVFKVGASLYGVADLMLLAEDTHKFESRYLDRLIGSLPAEEALYRERSPLSHVDEIAAPVIFFQGADDRVVPPNQADAMVAAMLKNQLPVAHYVFPGEGHGFRQAETIRRVLELELDFYAQIFGFDAVGLSEVAEIRNRPRRPA